MLKVLQYSLSESSSRLFSKMLRSCRVTVLPIYRILKVWWKIERCLGFCCYRRWRYISLFKTKKKHRREDYKFFFPSFDFFSLSKTTVINNKNLRKRKLNRNNKKNNMNKNLKNKLKKVKKNRRSSITRTSRTRPRRTTSWSSTLIIKIKKKNKRH